MLLPLMASAYDAYIDGIYYDLNKTAKTATVTWRGLNDSNKDAYTGTLNIPSTVLYNGEEYTVTKIEREAFKCCPNLLSITIPNSITYISGNTFDETGWYKNQPDGLVYLDNWIIDYKGEEPIGSITIAEGTRGIAEYAFYCRGYLTNITIPNTVKYIGIRAFEGCSYLSSVTLSSNITTIPWNAFENCVSLKSISIPSSVLTIDGAAFRHCKSLESVSIPNSVSSIGDESFCDCSGLTSISIPNTVTNIGQAAFYGCYNLSSVNIPNH